MGNPARIRRGKVFVEGLRLHAFHGHFDFERRDGQMFLIDLDLTLDVSAAATSDMLKATVDYGAVVETTRRVFCGPPHKLVEAAAYDIASVLLETFPSVESVVVRVGKIAPPIAAPLGSAGVDIEVARGE
jgi:7,8-dihydroneopterin aldolase/epimerase/oxygenase